MKRFALALTAVAALASQASAADMPIATKAPISPGTNWTGFYVGAMGGYAADAASGISPIKGGFAGGTVGFNYQTGPVVLGIEADAAWSDIKASAALPPLASATDRVLSTGTVRGRVGVAFDTVLLYGTGGYAWADNRLSVTVLGVTFTDTQLHSGWTAGGGVEVMVAPSWSVKAEYLYRSFQSQNYFAALIPPGVASGTLAVNSGQVGVNFHF